jgi:hypothetical protein
MRRLTARLLLGLAILGNLAPMVWAATTDPHLVCCVRNAVHHCHVFEGRESEKTSLRAADCCNRDCRLAVTTVQWALARSPMRTASAQDAEARTATSYSGIPTSRSYWLQSTRAPPFC